LQWYELRPAHDEGTNDRQPKKNHDRKHKTDNDCGERPIKPSANGGGTESGAKLAPDAEYIRFPY
jgi:hypothetical protein